MTTVYRLYLNYSLALVHLILSWLVLVEIECPIFQFPLSSSGKQTTGTRSLLYLYIYCGNGSDLCTIFCPGSKVISTYFHHNCAKMPIFFFALQNTKKHRSKNYCNFLATTSLFQSNK